jgi:hypothetical protein
MIRRTHATADSVVPMLTAALAAGVDTFMAPFAGVPHLAEAAKRAEDLSGRRIILVDTPTLNVEDSAKGRREAQAKIKQSREMGATFCLIHHASVEQLLDKSTRTIRRLEDYTAMIRDAGLIPGLSAHMPEAILYSDKNGYDVETYIQIFNCMGFLMQVEVEAVAKIIRNAKKPVMTIKPFAAGRTTPFIGLNFNWNVIRPCDMITIGASTELEAREDIEYSFAALERRAPNVEGRGSPVNQEVLGHM